MKKIIYIVCYFILLNFSYADIYSGVDLSGGKFNNMDLSWCNFSNSILKDTDFSRSRLVYTVFTSSDLTNANFIGANFLNATLTDSKITYCSFGYSSNFSFAHLISTASYKERNLEGIKLNFYIDLSYWDFSEQNLRNADFQSSFLTQTSFKNAQLQNVNFSGSVINNMDLTNADLRGTIFGNNTGIPTYKNTIMSDGKIQNLSLLLVEDKLTIRKYISTEDRLENISVKIAEDSLLINGSIIIEDGAFLEIEDNVTITLTDALEFIISDNIKDVSDVLKIGENTTIVIAGCTDEEARGVFTNLFKTKDGETVKLATPESFVIRGDTAVPEPAEWAMIFGVLALGLAVYRRRK